METNSGDSSGDGGVAGPNSSNQSAAEVVKLVAEVANSLHGSSSKEDPVSGSDGSNSLSFVEQLQNQIDLGNKKIAELIKKKVEEKLDYMDSMGDGPPPSGSSFGSFASNAHMNYKFSYGSPGEKRLYKRKQLYDDVAKVPVLTKNDIMAFSDEDRVALGKHVQISSPADRLYIRNAMGRDVTIGGRSVTISTIPDDHSEELAHSKVLVVDRGLHLGDTVGWAKNSYMQVGSNAWSERGWQQMHKGPTGIVMEYRVTGDLLVLPEKKRVLRNVDLGRCEAICLSHTTPKRTDRGSVSMNNAQQHQEVAIIEYDGWLGDVISQVDRIYLSYEGHTVSFTNEPHVPIALTRIDGSNEKKRVVPGEVVEVRLRDLLCNSATWEPSRPAENIQALSRGIRGRRYTVQCTVIRVEPEVYVVNWKRPISLGGPKDARASRPISPEIKGDGIAKMKVLVRQRMVCAGDRLKVPWNVVTEVDECSLDQYEDAVNRAYGPFVPKRDPSDLLRQASEDELRDRYWPGPRKCARMRYMKVGVGRFAVDDVPRNSPADEGNFEPYDDLPKVVTYDRKTVVCPVEEEHIYGEVMLTRTRVSIMWVDGTVTDDVDSRLLVPVSDRDQTINATIGISPLFPGVIVQKKTDRKPVPRTFGGYFSMDKGPNIRRDSGVFGVVLSVDDEERFARVQWLNYKDGAVQEVLQEEDCTLFDIVTVCSDSVMPPGRLGILLAFRGPSLLDNVFVLGRMLPNGERAVKFLNGNEEVLWPLEMKIFVGNNPADTLFAGETGISPSEGLFLKHYAAVYGGPGGPSVSDAKKKPVKHKTVIVTANTKGEHPLQVVADKLAQEYDMHMQEQEKQLLLYANGDDSKRPSSSNENKNQNLDGDASVDGVSGGEEKSVSPVEVVGEPSPSSSASGSGMPEVSQDSVSAKAMMGGPSSSGSTTYLSSQNKSMLESQLVESVQLLSEATQEAIKKLNVGAASGLMSTTSAHLIKNALNLSHDMDIYSDTDSFEELDTADKHEMQMLSMEGGTSSSTATLDFPKGPLRDRYKELVDDMTVLLTSILCSQPEESPLAVETKKLASKWSKKENPMSALAMITTTLPRLRKKYPKKFESLRKSDLENQVDKEIIKKSGPENKRNDDMELHVFNHELRRMLCAPNSERLFHDIDVFVNGPKQAVPGEGAEAYFEKLMAAQEQELEAAAAAMKAKESVDDGAMEEDVTLDGDAGGTAEPSGTGSPSEDNRSRSFELFSTCPSHKWLNDTSSGGPDFMRAMRKEHRLLADLPEGIYVRAYEDRLDLMHAIIVGPRGTPFDSTPFFFEIKLPDDYPNKPPKLNFCAYSSEALNPNLYQEGKVCLSLLGTWSGRPSEKWNPKQSNLPQVLISIQALILNAEPYWNEPGREHTKHDPVQSMASKRYNEATTINSIQYMERIVASPPPHFDQLIRRLASENVTELRARIAEWFTDDGRGPEYPLPRLSKGFHMALNNAIDKVQVEIYKAEEAEKTELAALVGPCPVEANGSSGESSMGVDTVDDDQGEKLDVTEVTVASEEKMEADA